MDILNSLTTAQDKKNTVLRLMEKSSVYIAFDPRPRGVVVPPQFKQQERLVLQIGLNLAIPIRDLEVGDEGWSGTLSFDRCPFHCIVPWDVVEGIVDETGNSTVWSTTPTGITIKHLKKLPPKAPAPKPPESPKAAKPLPPYLRVVK